MKWLNKHWIGILITICVLCLIANIVVLYFYRSIFDGGISNELNNWNLFLLAFNGLITAILTVVNICVFVKINKSIDNNNETRQVKDLLYDAQMVLARIRMDDYKYIKELINDIKLSIYHKHLSAEKIDLLKKKLMEIDNSFLYNSQNFHDEPFLRSITVELVTQLDEFLNKVKVNREINTSDEESLHHTLSSFLNIMEFYIISQLVRGGKVLQYINENKDEMDCTISSIYDFAKEVVEKMEPNK